MWNLASKRETSTKDMQKSGLLKGKTMAQVKAKETRKTCPECGKEFTTVKASDTCQECLTKLAKAFWETMGCEMPIVP